MNYREEHLLAEEECNYFFSRLMQLTKKNLLLWHYVLYTPPASLQESAKEGQFYAHALELEAIHNTRLIRMTICEYFRLESEESDISIIVRLSGKAEPIITTWSSDSTFIRNYIDNHSLFNAKTVIPLIKEILSAIMKRQTI